MIDVNVVAEKSLSEIVLELIDSVAENLSRTVESESSQHVHDLRIATRRALAGLDLLQRLISGRERKWFKKRLREIRHAAGEVRDLDVMLVRHGNDHRLSRKLTKRRARSFGQVHDVHQRLIEEGRFAKHQTRLFDSQVRISEFALVPLSDQDLCLDSFNVIVAEFLAMTRPLSFKIDRLHQLRKRGKHLRYALEIVSEFLPRDDVRELRDTSKSLQSRLGEINDYVVAVHCISGLSKETKGKKRKREMRRLRKEERRRLKEEIRQLKTWWTPVLVGELELAAKRVSKRNGLEDQSGQ